METTSGYIDVKTLRCAEIKMARGGAGGWSSCGSL